MLTVITKLDILGSIALVCVFSLPIVVIIVDARLSNPGNRRFSLRTLLIGTTLAAVVLGLIVAVL